MKTQDSTPLAAALIQATEALSCYLNNESFANRHHESQSELLHEEGSRRYVKWTRCDLAMFENDLVPRNEDRGYAPKPSQGSGISIQSFVISTSQYVFRFQRFWQMSYKTEVIKECWGIMRYQSVRSRIERLKPSAISCEIHCRCRWLS